ncbi:MAG: copper chaperone PCu(A)C [Gemmatimonadota bacterium]|nr:copper chaperone PCu(A)C [Gemmatimonadota bacterium]
MRPLLVGALLVTAACGGGAPPGAGTLAIRDPWARSADSGTVTAVYLVVTNGESGPATYTGASSPAAESVSLHETMAMNGMVHMMALDTAQVIAPGDSLVLREGGKHLMVNGLRRRLVAGDTLPVTVRFADGRALEVRVPVRSAY